MKGLAFVSIAIALTAAGCGSSESGTNACGTESSGNTSRDRAAAYPAGSQATGCVGNASEVHYFDLASTGDATGGYVQGMVDVGLGIDIYAKGDETLITHIDPDPAGGPTTFFLAVAPGEDYQLGIKPQGAFTAPFTFTLNTSYTAVPDTYEPNDALAMAAPVTEGVPINGYLFGGRLGGDATAMASDDYADYYRFSAAAGTITIQLAGVPADLAPRLTLYAADGSELARVASGQKGSSLQMLSPSIAAPSDLIVRVTPWSGAPPSMGAGTMLPAHFTQTYTLMISQP
jgi:hypothetical protein